MLAKDPARRYPTPAEAAGALEAILPGQAPQPRQDPRMSAYQGWVDSLDGAPPERGAAPPPLPPPAQHRGAPAEEPGPEDTPSESLKPTELLALVLSGMLAVLALGGLCWLLYSVLH